MPIANCFVNENYKEHVEDDSDLIALWANVSHKSPEHMTVNIIYTNEQHGNTYAVMAHLLLPTVWSVEDISLLQTGLAKALACFFQAPINEIHIITTHVESGRVVEQGKEVIW